MSFNEISTQLIQEVNRKGSGKETISPTLNILRSFERDQQLTQ